MTDAVSGWSCGAWFTGSRKSRKLVLFIVTTALLLDNILLTMVVPIIPEFLYIIRRDEQIRVEIAAAEAARLTTTEIPNTMNPLTKMPRRTIHEELTDETTEIGLLFASKAFVQLLANPFVGPLTNRIGYSIPMLTGFLITFISTTIFAYGRSYSVLFLARAMQGLGSSCFSVSGMGMLADRYPDDKERGNAMAVAIGGMALGVLIGPPFGGVMYQFIGKSEPFLILAGLTVGVGLLQLLVLQPGIVRRRAEAPSLMALLLDPYIIVAAGAIVFVNMGIGVLEPALPIHMMDTLNAPRWQLGAVFLPSSMSFLIGTGLFGRFGHRIGRWLAAMIGLIAAGICLLCIPLAPSLNYLIAPSVGLGFAIGMVVCSMMPELGRLVDIRHPAAVYGSVYAIGDVAFCIAFAIGPYLSGILVKNIGFGWMLVAMAVITFAYAPALFLLRAPPTILRGTVENLL